MFLSINVMGSFFSAVLCTRPGQFVAMPDHYGDWNTTEPSRFNAGKFACFFVSSADFFFIVQQP